MTLAHPLAAFHVGFLGWMIGAWIAYFTINLVLVAGVLAWRDTFWGSVFEDFWHNALMTFAVLALSPLVLVVGDPVLAAHAVAADPAAAALLHRPARPRARARGRARRPDRAAEPRDPALRARERVRESRPRGRDVRAHAHRPERLQADQRHARAPGGRLAARALRPAPAEPASGRATAWPASAATSSR